MTRLQFFGAAREVTGSLFLVVTSNEKRVLVDCGLHQGRRLAERANYEPFDFDPSSIAVVVLTHAHLDHVGRLPKLVKEGFSGPIVATAATADLTHLVLTDAQKVLQEEAQAAGHEPLYELADVNAVVTRFQKVNYAELVAIHGVTVRLHDAGHILGSAIVELTDGPNTLVFSGDLGNAGTPILRETQVPTRADIVVMESTYGGRVHESIGQRDEMLRQAIIDTAKRHGVLMIPAFAIERTQELLYEIDQLEQKQAIPKLPIFLDSPLAINATAIFERYSTLWNRPSQLMKASGDDFFHFPGLQRTLTVAQSKRINEVRPPKVIIAGAGMMVGGRILHHLKRYLPDTNSTVIVVGYQAKGTLGREILDGAKRVKIHDQWVSVKASVVPIGAYSAHADRPQLVGWLRKIKGVQKVALVHGEPEEMAVLGQGIKEKIGLVAKIPKLGDGLEI